MKFIQSLIFGSILAITGCTSKVEKYNQQGHLNFLHGKYSEAEICYSKVIELDGKNSEAYFGRGFSDLLSEYYRNSVADFTKVIELEPRNVDAFRYRGYAKFLLSDYRGANEDCNKVIEFEPKEESSLLDRIEVRIKLNDLNGIVNDYSRLIDINKQNSSAYFERSYARSELNDFNGSMLDLIKVMELDNNLLLSKIGDIDVDINYLNPRSYAFFSDLRFIAGNRILYEVLTNLISIQPDNYNALILRGLTRLRYNTDVPYAIEDFDKAIEISPGNSNALTLRAILNYFNWKARYRELDSKRKEVLYPLFNFNNGNWKYQKGYVDTKLEALVNELHKRIIADLTMAIKNDHSNTVANLFLKKLYDYPNKINSTTSNKSDNYDQLRTKDLDELYKQIESIQLKDSIGIIADYIKIFEKNPYGKYYFIKEGKNVSVQKGYERIRLLFFKKTFMKYNNEIENHKENTTSFFNRAIIRIYFQNFTGANDDFTKAINLDPKNVKAYINRACVRSILSDYNGAKEDYTKLIEIDSKNGLYYFNRGLIYALKLKQKETGCNDLSKAGELGYINAYKAIRQLCE
ncbi:MAG: hypothetical protein NTZ69_16500 [Bacteroidia bacterium]|nr:hypothetical protein [Bacteroidia bacterium]